MGSLVETRREIQPDDGLLDVIVVRAPGPVLGLGPDGRRFDNATLARVRQVMSFERRPGTCGSRPGAHGSWRWMAASWGRRPSSRRSDRRPHS